MSLSQLLWIGLGGALGSMGRAAIGHWLQAGFPWSTLAVNLVGSLLLGLVAGLALRESVLHPHARDFLAIGFCGGFTTFSTFSLQTLELLRSGQSGVALANVLASVAGCLLMAWVGFWLVRDSAAS